MNNVSEGIREITCRIFENKGVMSCVFFLGRLFSCNKKNRNRNCFCMYRDSLSLSLSLFFPYSSMQHFFYSTVDLFGCTNWARIFKAKYEIKHQKYFRVLKLYLKQCFVYTTSKLFQKNWLSYWDFILKQNWKKWIDFLLFFWDWLELRCYLSKAQRRQGRERGGVGWLMLQKTFGTLTQKGRL